MIRFVDLSEAYWTDPVENGGAVCAFLDTVTDRFVEMDGCHTALGSENLDGIEDVSLRERCRALIPDGFWDRT